AGAAETEQPAGAIEVEPARLDLVEARRALLRRTGAVLYVDVAGRLRGPRADIQRGRRLAASRSEPRTLKARTSSERTLVSEKSREYQRPGGVLLKHVPNQRSISDRAR